MRVKRKISLVLSILMLSGCSNEASTEITKVNEVTNQTEVGQSEEIKKEEVDYPETGTYPIPGAEGITLTYWRSWPATVSQYFNDYGETEVYKEIMKRTGVNIEFIHPTIGEEKNQFNLMAASGDFPDIMTQGAFAGDYYPGGPTASVDDGLCIDLTPYLQEYAPDFYKIITSDESLYRDITDNDGKISAFTTIKDATPAWNRPLVCTENFEKYADGKILETIEDYEFVFEKMYKDGIPGLIIPLDGYTPLFMQPFDVMQGLHLDKNNEVVYGQIQPGFKEYVELMRDWYEKGYIYKDFMTIKTFGEIDSLFGAGDVGMCIRSVGVIYGYSLAEGYEFVAMPYPRLEKGQSLHFDTPAASLLENAPTSVSTSCKYPEIAVQFLNYLYSEDGAELANWGVDEAWDEMDGKKVYTDYMLNNEDYKISTTRMTLRLHVTVPKLSEPDVICDPETIKDENALALRNLYADDETIDASMVLPNIRLTPEANSERAKILTDVDTYVDEMVLKFITGAISMSEWDNYVKQIETMNIERAIELTKEGYDQYMNKPLPLMN